MVDKSLNVVELWWEQLNCVLLLRRFAWLSSTNMSQADCCWLNQMRRICGLRSSGNEVPRLFRRLLSLVAYLPGLTAY